MSIDKKIRDEKLQYNIFREAVKISASDQSQLIEQAKFIYSPLEKAFEKETKHFLTKERKKLML